MSSQLLQTSVYGYLRNLLFSTITIFNFRDLNSFLTFLVWNHQKSVSVGGFLSLVTIFLSSFSGYNQKTFNSMMLFSWVACNLRKGDIFSFLSFLTFFLTVVRKKAIRKQKPSIDTKRNGIRIHKSERPVLSNSHQDISWKKKGK